jgi:hypothetical protein
MDINCPVCAEPWDMDTLHTEIEERLASGEMSEDTNYNVLYFKMSDEFKSKGCKAFTFTGAAPWCVKPDNDSQYELAAVASALYDLLGDDMDGAASMLEDWVS